ncbi:hypothetical protein TWF718_003536 [Orbilia javanica]|uniref:Uncharacterized protein n=1 Tax=Orbilia javanica TaxID=47235 RepID=A0AAN8MSY6_9PEZI
MYLAPLIIALGAISAASATEVCVGVCNADNCLRALRATQIATRLPQASADCARIIDVTYTPPTVTKTEYETATQIATVTIPSTFVQSFYDIQTDIVWNTATTVVTVTSTFTQAPLNKRDASISFPSYATPCSGFYRFSSACSCIGVTPRIITVPAPSTTITIPTGETSSTSVTEVETTSVTVTTATVSVTTIATTITNTAITTKTELPPSVTGLGKIYIGTLAANSYIVERLYSGSTAAAVSSNAASAMQLRLEGDGRLFFASYVATVDLTLIGVNSAQPIVFFNLNLLSPTTTKRPLICSRASNYFISCSVQNGASLVPLTLAYPAGNTPYVLAYDPDTTATGTVIQIRLT